MEEIRPGLFRIEIPLPNKPLRSLNSWVVASADRCLIIDTGMNREECLTAMEAGLDELGLDRSRCDYFITHLHADHTGLMARLPSPSSRVFFSRVDAESMRDPDHWEQQLQSASRHGFPEAELRRALAAHPGHRYSPASLPELTLGSPARSFQARIS